ncbi:MAG: hypothetical protein V3T64_00415, partial [Myxococcota bacterium]
MTFDAVRRRYGYGAARLAIGGGANAPSLAQLARSPVDRELPFASLPGLVCVVISALLLWAMDLETAPAELAFDTAQRESLRIRMLPDATTPRPIEISKLPKLSPV